ncbi:MAG: hypothetical protein RLZZ517_108 [Candidatus Parcubacteria bacterium]|jgi:hypothetical protein
MPRYIAAIKITEKDEGVHVGYRGEVESKGVYVEYVDGEPGPDGLIARTRYEALGEFIMKESDDLKLWIETDNQR